MTFIMIYLLTSNYQTLTMAHDRVLNPWILAEPDDDRDVKVTAARNVTVSTFRTFLKCNN
jgi:hypothetical protein